MAYPKIICLEGVDGVGKSTVAEHLIALLTENDYPALHVPSPARDLPVGQFLRNNVLPHDKAPNWSHDVTGKLFEASFLETAWSLIKDREYTDRDVIILDRWTYTTLVYQQLLGLEKDDSLNICPTEVNDFDSGLWNSIIQLFDHLPDPWHDLLRFPTVYHLEAPDTQVIVDRLRAENGRKDIVETLDANALAEYQTAYRDMYAFLEFNHVLQSTWSVVTCDQDAFEIAHRIFQDMLNGILA